MSIKDWLDILTAFGTVSAAIAAAVSAYISKQSADAARDAVEEARKSRESEIAPKLILEKNFLDLRALWPHPETLNGEPVIRGRTFWKNLSWPDLPSFNLQNFGQSPALEVAIVWEVSYPLEGYEIPDELRSHGITFHEARTNEGVTRALEFSSSKGGVTYPLYTKVTTAVPNSSPGKVRNIEFPVHILFCLLARALDRRYQPSNTDQKVIVSARICCYTIDKKYQETVFKWHATPWIEGVSPFIGNIPFFEIPVTDPSHSDKYEY